jgi:hypothetical protein
MSVSVVVVDLEHVMTSLEQGRSTGVRLAFVLAASGGLLSASALGQAGQNPDAVTPTVETDGLPEAFIERFDDRAVGVMQMGGPWSKWVDQQLGISSPAEISISDDVSFSGGRSLRLDPGADVVLQLPLATSGQWRVRMMVYVPANTVGSSAIGLLNRYTPSSPAGADGTWDLSSRLTIDAQGPSQTGTITDGLMVFPIPELRIAYNRWVELRWDIDLTADRFSVYYDGALLGPANRAWSTNFTYRGPSGPTGMATPTASIAAFNLSGPPMVASPLGRSIFVDDISMVQTSIQLSCYANCDGSTGTPQLSPADYTCFLARYRAGDLYANCDGSTGVMLSPADYTCFLSKYRAGCP